MGLVHSFEREEKLTFAKCLGRVGYQVLYMLSHLILIKT